MPSPVGHALAAVAAGWAIARPATPRRALIVQSSILAVVGAAPDLDLLINRHSAETHSLGAAVIVATLAAWMAWPVADTRWRIWLAVALAWATHPLLDALADDSSPPIGIMAFWPVTRVYVHAAWTVFDSIYRHWWETGFLSHNLLAIAKEIALLAPITGAVGWIRGRGIRS
jgi:membrane-bound metal-dependent hydrolase YbcI (DUF457 family)